MLLGVALAFEATKWVTSIRGAGGNADDTRSKESEAKAPVNAVEVDAVERREISEQVTAYGQIAPKPGDTRSMTIPFETRIIRVLVSAGQTVQFGERLLRIEPSPNAQLQLRQAKNAADAAARDLEQTKARFNLKLATNQELGQAQKIATDTSSQLQAFRFEQFGDDLQAQQPALVVKVDVQEGQIVAPGSPLLELIDPSSAGVLFGVKPELVHLLQPDQSVSLLAYQQGASEPITGKLVLITHQLDPATGLVNVFASIERKALLGSHVQAQLNVMSKETLVVPKKALVLDNSTFSVMVVENGKVKKQLVQIGLENLNEAEIISPDIKQGDQVVTVGSYELRDGDEIKVEPKT